MDYSYLAHSCTFVKNTFFFMIVLLPFENVMSIILYLILHCCILDVTNKAIYMNYVLQEESLFGLRYFTLGLNRVIGNKDS